MAPPSPALHTGQWQPSLVEGKLEADELKPRRLMVNANDPQGAAKPFFMGEAGIDDGNTGDNQLLSPGLRTAL